MRTVGEFFAACQNHDWYTDWSDSAEVRRRGATRLKELKAEAATSPAKQRIFDEWKAYHFSGSTFGTDQAPKPSLADYPEPWKREDT